MPLCFASAGQANIVKQIKGRDETRNFLGSLGFVEGSCVTVVSQLGENVIVRVKDSRVALSRDMALRIMV